MFFEGNIGAFVIHKKTLNLTERFPAIRTAFVGENIGDAKIGNIIVNKSKIGGRRKYSIENSDWFDSVSKLIDNAGDAYCQWLTNPFFGTERIIINKDTNAMIERQEKNALYTVCIFNG